MTDHAAVIINVIYVDFFKRSLDYEIIILSAAAC